MTDTEKRKDCEREDKDLEEERDSQDEVCAHVFERRRGIERRQKEGEKSERDTDKIIDMIMYQSVVLKGELQQKSAHKKIKPKSQIDRAPA